MLGRLQNYLGLRLERPDAVWVLDGSGFLNQGRKSAGVARQYCGRLGKVANCQPGMFLAHDSPAGAGPGGQTAVSAGELDLGQRPVRSGRGAGGETELLVEDGVGLGAAGASLGAGGPSGWPGTTPSGCRRPSGRPWRPWGSATCWTFRAAHRSGPWSWPGPVRNIRGSGAPANPSSGTGSAGSGDASGEEGESIPLWDEAAHRGGFSDGSGGQLQRHIGQRA